MVQDPRIRRGVRLADLLRGETSLVKNVEGNTDLIDPDVDGNLSHQSLVPSVDG